MSYTIYFPENLANYNFSIAAAVGLIIVLVIVAFFVGISRSRRVRRRPE